MEGNKPGWKKTEFWVTLLTVHVPTLYSAIQGLIPVEIAAYIHIGGSAAFALFNTVQKAIENWKQVKATQSTVTTTAPVTTVTTPQ